MSNIISTRMLILGSGPAGLTAAIYAARAGLSPVVVQGIQPGGQLTTTTDVENYPGFRDVIQGPWLMEEMQAQAEHVGTRMLWDTIVSIDLDGPPFRAIGDGGDIYEGETLVIATGAQVVAAVDQGDFGRVVGQVQCLFDRGVAPADHRDASAAIEEPVAGRAGRNALARQLDFARNA